MELIFVTAIGICLAVIVRYTIPGRTTSGILLIPAIGGAVTCASWVVLVWAGLTFDGGWIWLISLAAGLIASILAAVILPRRRRAADDELFRRLSHARA
jgi:hypothetical protein